jgi:hypothetical protein
MPAFSFGIQAFGEALSYRSTQSVIVILAVYGCQICVWYYNTMEGIVTAYLLGGVGIGLKVCS